MIYSLIDETYNPSNSEHYKLTIQYLPDGFSFVIFDTIRKKFVLLKHFELKSNSGHLDELKSIIEKENLFDIDFQSSKAFLFTNKTTIIPTPFTAKDKIEQFIEFNFGKNNVGKYHHCKAHFETTLAFSIEEDLFDFFNKKCQKVFPFSIALLSEANKIKTLKDKHTGMFISLLNGYAEVVILSAGNLSFFNIFPFKTNDDLSYFLLYLFDVFSLDKENDTISISGIIPKNDLRIKSLETFFKKIEFSKVEKQFVYSYRFNEVPQHYFSNLYLPLYEDN